MRYLIAALAGLFMTAAYQPQDPPEKKTVYPDPHAKENRDRYKPYKDIVKECAPKHEKITRYKAALKYTGSEPYNDDPINYEGFVVYAKTKESTDCYIELGKPVGNSIKPMIRVYHTDTKLIVVDEEYMTYTEQIVDVTDAKTWKPWTFFALAMVKEMEDAYEVFVECDGHKFKSVVQRTPEEEKTWYGEMDAATLQKYKDEAERLAKLNDNSDPRISLRLKPKDEKGCFMRMANINLDNDLFVPVYLCTINRNATTTVLEAVNIDTKAEIDRELFKKVPALRDEKLPNGSLKYKKTS